MNIHLPLVSNSEIGVFRSCKRRWKFAYRMLRRGNTTTAALKFGTLMHLGLEAYFKSSGSLADAIAAMRGDAESDPYELAKAEALMMGYRVRWSHESDFTVTHVEEHFVVPIEHPDTGEILDTSLTGKIDALVTMRDGRRVLVEHKTSGESIDMGSYYWMRLTLDSQLSAYNLATDTMESLYDVIAKLKLKPYEETPDDKKRFVKKTGKLDARQHERDETPAEFRDRCIQAIEEAPERYFQRGYVVRTPEELSEAQSDFFETVLDMRDAIANDRYPRNPKACMMYGSACPYLEVCCRSANIDDDTKFHTVSTPHTELQTVEEA